MNDKFKRIDSYIGYFSYPIYISHYLVLIFYSVLFDYGKIDGSVKLGKTALVPYLICLIGFSFLLVYFVDVGIDKYKRKLKLKKVETN